MHANLGVISKLDRLYKYDPLCRVMATYIYPVVMTVVLPRVLANVYSNNSYY
jgi:hypothetical protein